MAQEQQKGFLFIRKVNVRCCFSCRYLADHPLFLPDMLVPYAENPQLSVRTFGQTSGYVEVLSHCMCGGKSTSVYRQCSKATNVCPNPIASGQRL